MPPIFTDTTLNRQNVSALAGRLYEDSEVVRCIADEAMTPGLLVIRTGAIGTEPIVSAALTANLPTAQVTTATFSGVTTGDVVQGVVNHRGKTFTVAEVTYATSMPATLAAAAAAANVGMDAAGFTAARSIAFTSDATTIAGTLEVKGETAQIVWNVTGTGTVTHATTNPGIFADNTAKPVVGIVSSSAAYSLNTVDTIDDKAPVSVVRAGSVDAALVAAGALTYGAALYVEPASGKLTPTETATTVWIPPAFLRATEIGASSTSYPEGAACRVQLRS